jgi:hypothetical protein
MSKLWIAILATSAAVPIFGALSACGAKTAETPAESKTNWLEACDVDAECGADLACHCGVCTLNCETASCPGALECLGTCGGKISSCQAPCAADEDCTYLAEGATCRAGVCGIDGNGLSANQVTNATPTPAISDEQFDAAKVTAEEASLADDTGGAWRLIEVPAANTMPDVIETPIGWLSLSSRTIGDGRLPQGYGSALYRSTDGVHWELLPFDSSDDQTDLRSIAYGNGRYVVMGRKDAKGTIWSSSDAESWMAIEQTGDSVNHWGEVLFAGGYFFGLGFQYLGVSADGISWTSVPISTIQIRDIAYGNGRYVLVGGGPIQSSADGLTWQAHELDCALPEAACVMTPDTPSSPDGTPGAPGEVVAGYRSHVVFAEGRFFTDQFHSSDGARWEPAKDRFPTAYVAGRFLGGVNLASGLPFWTRGGPIDSLRVARPAREAVLEGSRTLLFTGVLDKEAPLPETVSVEFDDGLTCETAECVLVDGRLLLVPPAGTPPLPDKVPRKADGTPLLSDDCPVSAQLFCDDYETREGCVCEPEAPHTPEWCDDVSQYQCEGTFVHRDGEWELDEIREGGCDCNYVDPNQPVGFGTDCSADMTICVAPLACLPLETIVSSGPPYQPYACTVACTTDEDCPTWEATGFCAGPVELRCAEGSCQPRTCN